MSTAVSSRQKIERANLERDLPALMRELFAPKTAIQAQSIIVIAGPSGKIACAGENTRALFKHTRKEFFGCEHRNLDSGVRRKVFFRATRSTGATLSIASRHSGGTSTRTHLHE